MQRQHEKSGFRYFLFCIRTHPRAFAIGIVSLFITNFLDAIYPLILKKGIDQIEANVNFNEITKTSILFLVIMASLSVTRFAWRMGFGYFHTFSAEIIRKRLFNHISYLSPRFFQKNPVGELMSLMTNDVQSFRQAIGPGLLILADGFIIIAIVLPIMLGLNASWTWKTLIFLPAVPFIIWYVMKLIHSRYRLQQDKFSELTGMAQETVGGIRVVKSFALENKRIELFNQLSSSFEKSCNSVARVDSLFGPVMEFGVASGSVILLFIAKDDLYSGAVSIGTFVAFHRYISKMVWPMTALGMGLSMFQKGFASFDRMKEVLATQTEVPDIGQKVLEKFETLEFKNVSFAYNEKSPYILQNINFKIHSGETIGLIGPVGTGKTTMINLICRFYALSEGQILVNNTPIEEYTLHSLRKIFVTIPQEAFLFSDSIKDNITFGLDQAAEFEQIQRMTEIVDIKNEVISLPQGFDSQLGERGVNLSGGQKQRLTLARGLITRAPVLILDDSLSAVDTKTELAINNELQQYHGQTRLIIAHRLSTLKNADKIIVLKDGQIEAMGSHNELMSTSETYQTITSMQNTEANHE